jgi:hypothetical protein
MSVAAAEPGLIVEIGRDRTPMEVQPKDGCSCAGGSWVCCTHPDVPLPNQLQKDIHIGHGEHVLAWMCLEHGLEVP